MKKILSLVLVLCMLAASCVFLASCSKVSAKKVEADPQATLSEAIQNTSNNFFTDDANAGKVLNDALKSGAFTVSFESADLMGGDLTKISETIYVDSENQKYVSDTNVTYGGEDLSARIFLDKNGLMLNSEAILGSNKTLAVNLATFADKFDESALVELFGLDEETVGTVNEVVATLKTALEKSAQTNEESAKALANEYLALLKQNIAEEKLENADGKKVKHVVVTYTLNNETVKAFAEKAMAQMDLGDELNTEAKASLDEMIKEMNETVAIDLSVKLYINTKTNAVTKIAVSGTVTDKEDNTAATVAGEIAFSDTEIKLTANVSGIEDPITAEVKLTKEEADGTVTYKLTVNGSSGSVSVNVLNASYSYTKSSGAIVLSADIINEDNKRTSATLNGKLTVTSDEASLEFTSLKLDEETLNFKLLISAKKVSEIPATPTDAKDIVTMTQGEWVDVMNEFQNSKLGKMIFGTGSY